MQTVELNAGEVARIRVGYSELACHMGVAGKHMLVRIVGAKYPMVQLMNDDFSHFSFPITLGEAGIWHNTGFHGKEYYAMID